MVALPPSVLTAGSALLELAGSNALLGDGAIPTGSQVAGITQAPASDAVTLAWSDAPGTDGHATSMLGIWQDWLDDLRPSLQELRELLERLAAASQSLSETAAEADAAEADVDK